MNQSFKFIIAIITILVLIYLIIIGLAWLGGEAISLDFLIETLKIQFIAVVLAIIIIGVASGLCMWVSKDD